MKKVVVAAGGTGGHIVPAISIAKQLHKSGCQILYVGNQNSLEERLAKAAGFDFEAIDVQKLYRHFTFAHFKFPFKLIKSINRSKKIFKEFGADAFLGTGGFVSGPVGYAANKLRVPIFLQEQNSYPGLTTRLLGKKSKIIFLGSQAGKKYLTGLNTFFSGNPINANTEIDQLDLKQYGFRTNAKKLFLLGGSQGSLALNKAIYPILDQLYENNIDLFWQIGQYSWKEFSTKVKDKPGIYAFSFTSKINQIYQAADFALARGGALSLAELEVNKIPTLIVPLPSAAGNHQYYNALEWKNNAIGNILEQKDLSPGSLLIALRDLSDNLVTFKENFKISKHQNAAAEIADQILKNLN